MIRTIHQWLLVILYRLATWVRHRAISWQKLLRHALLPYAVRDYHPRWPETAKPVKRWKQRLAEAQNAGNPISPVNHRRPLPDDCHCPECGAPRDYLYNFGYDNGHSGDEAYHKVQCKICGFQTAPVRPKKKPTFFCPYCRRALVKVKERKDFDVYKCKSKRCPYTPSCAVRALACLRRQISLVLPTRKAQAWSLTQIGSRIRLLSLMRQNQAAIESAATIIILANGSVQLFGFTSTWRRDLASCCLIGSRDVRSYN